MMRTMIIRKMKPVGYLFFAWAGRGIYGFRLRLEELNDWVDLKAGEYWEE